MLDLSTKTISDKQVSDLESKKETEFVEDTPTIRLVESVSVRSKSKAGLSDIGEDVDCGSQLTSSMHVAQPVFKYYWLRFTNFAIDFALTAVSYVVILLCVALIRSNGNGHLIPLHESTCLIWSSMVFAALKFERGMRGYSSSRLRVVDGNGASIKSLRSLARAVAFSLTWFLFPVHLVLMATGSRQLLHDSLSGCYVVSKGENPASSIYPPAPKWIAVLLVIGCVWLVFSLEQVRTHWDRLELGAAQVLMGTKNPLYARYLGAKCNLSLLEITELSQGKAEEILPRFESLADLQNEFTSSAGNDSYSILQIYKAALVAARANKAVITAQYLEILGALPGIDIERALGERWIDVLEFETSPRLRAANLLRKVGHRETAIALAKAEKESAKKTGDGDRLNESTKLIDLANTQEPDYDPFAPVVNYYDSDMARAMRAVRIQLRNLDDSAEQ